MEDSRGAILFCTSLFPSRALRLSWVARVRENLRQALIPVRCSASSANGAPLHLLTIDGGGQAGQAQTVSAVAHAAALTAIFLFMAYSGKLGTPPPGEVNQDRWDFHLSFIPPEESAGSNPSLGIKSGGGEEEARPARRGFLAPGFSQPLAPPRMPVNQNPQLPVPAAVFDAEAPAIVPVVGDLGLPWMKGETNSAGPGKNHGFGTGKDGGMGDEAGAKAGQGEQRSRYANGISHPACSYCPDPVYTDEAREAKLQGTVTLRVLVGADGRAKQIQRVKSLGMGLEERAMEAVRGWRFSPARRRT